VKIDQDTAFISRRDSVRGLEDFRVDPVDLANRFVDGEQLASLLDPRAVEVGVENRTAGLDLAGREVDRVGQHLFPDRRRRLDRGLYEQSWFSGTLSSIPLAPF